MPYHTEKAEGGYYVVSEGGTRLSKKPLSEARAKKQLTAANLSYLRSEGRIPPRPAKTISMPKKNFVAEHKQLIRMLGGAGCCPKCRDEAAKQKKELDKYI